MTLPKSITNWLEQAPRISVAKIRENVITLRTEYEKESLKELGDSIEDQGQLQPVIVQPADDEGYFDLVIGSRRLRAIKAKGHRDVVAHVIDRRTPVELFLIALAENLHRQDLNPFEEAQGFLRLMREFNLDLKTITKGVNKSEHYVRGRLQLLSMPEEVVEMVAEQKLPINSVKTLARLPSGEDQVRLARTAVKHHLSQAELATHVQRELAEPPRKEAKSRDFSSVKLRARISLLVTFFQKVPRRLNLRRMNMSEKQSIIQSIDGLIDELRSLREMVRSSSVSAPMPHPNLTRSHTDPSNFGQEWTTRDIRRIHSPRRPSDEELADELGRSVSAIRAMRAQTKDDVK